MDLLSARGQMGISLAFHIIFAVTEFGAIIFGPCAMSLLGIKAPP
jgi:hypothetical protein